MPGMKIREVNINNLRYADNIVLIAKSESDLQNILNKVVSENKKIGLQINIKKTEYMIISNKHQ